MKRCLILLTLAIRAACTKEVADDSRPADGRYSMTVKASKVGTKALALDDGTLNATWTQGDVIKVYKGDDEIGELTAQSTGTPTTLRGELTVAPSADDILTLKFLSPSYASQNGTLEYIESHCDYATATVNVKSIAGVNVTIKETSASFTNQQAIVKFTLLDNADGTTPVNATELTVSDGTNTYTVTPASATNVLFVALPGFSDKTVTITATDGNYNYTYEKSDVTFMNSKYYEITVKFGALSGAGTEAVPFIISSEADWNLLADKVNSGYTYSGKYFRLATDISITTMVGNSTDNSFRGTFDGDGHTLTINYNTTSDYTAPFRYIQGATFKNLKVTGNITTTKNLAAGIAGLNTNAVATFEQCATDVTINSSSTTEVGWGRVDYHGGLLARTNNVNVNITDCVCGGSVDGSNSASSTAYGASFVGVAVGCTVTGTRCLSTTSYTNVTVWNPLCHAADAVRSTSAFYYVNGNDVCDGATQVTLSDLNNSSYATALQAGRSTTVWVQYARTNQPMLKQFATYIVTYNANGGSGSVPAAQAKQQGDDLTLSNSILTLGGFTHTGWNTSSDGSGTHYDIGGTYSADADVTLYAEWSSLTVIFTGAVQTFTVPATGYYTLECYGAQGGYSSGGLGGKGGLSQLTYPLTKGDILYIYVGGQGGCIDGGSVHTEGGDGGWNGGGKGGTGVKHRSGSGPFNGGGGGGGATHIATSAIGTDYQQYRLHGQSRGPAPDCRRRWRWIMLGVKRRRCWWR